MLILGNKAVALDLVQGVAEIERDMSLGFSEEAVIGSLKNIPRKILSVGNCISLI